MTSALGVVLNLEKKWKSDIVLKLTKAAKCSKYKYPSRNQKRLSNLVHMIAEIDEHLYFNFVFIPVLLAC